MSIEETLGHNLKQLRKNRGLSQESIAESSVLNQSRYSRIENGRENPTIKTVEGISEALNIEAWQLFLPSEGEVAAHVRNLELLKSIDLKSYNSIIQLTQSLAAQINPNDEEKIKLRLKELKKIKKE